MRVFTLTIAVFLLPYSASQPPVWKSIWLTTSGSNSSFRLPEIPAGTGTPSTEYVYSARWPRMGTSPVRGQTEPPIDWCKNLGGVLGGAPRESFFLET